MKTQRGSINYCNWFAEENTVVLAPQCKLVVMSSTLMGDIMPTKQDLISYQCIKKNKYILKC